MKEKENYSILRDPIVKFFRGLDEHDMIEKKSRVYKILKSLEKYDNLNDKLQQIVESVVKYFDAKFARIWLVDKEREYMILKFSAGKYKNIHGDTIFRLQMLNLNLFKKIFQYILEGSLLEHFQE
jgi:hypothetical protein